MEWYNHRREDGTIDLISAFEDKYRNEYIKESKMILIGVYLNKIEEFELIKSRQVAAVALANAYMLLEFSNLGD